MGKYNFKGGYSGKYAITEIDLSLISFNEGDVTIIYSPALDLSGYGYNEDEAKKSFEITLEEFLNYIIEKETLASEFEKMSWKLTFLKKQKQLIPPKLDELLIERSYLSKIFQKEEFHKYNHSFSLPTVLCE